MDQLKTIKELINQGDIENALQALEEFLQTEPVGKDEAYYLMGNAYRKLGDWQKPSIIINPPLNSIPTARLSRHAK